MIRALRNLLPVLLIPASLFAGAISGTVRGPDSTSAGIANAKVLLTKGGGGGTPRLPIDSTTTNAQGQYSFTNLPTATNYGVTGSATGFQTISMNRLSVDTAATLTVNLTLPMPYGPATILGTVRGPDSTGPFLPNTMVVLSKPGATFSAPRVLVDSIKTDANGKFSFANLPSLDGYGIAIAATATTGPYSNTRVNLRGANDTLNIILSLPPGPGTIKGRVTGPDTTVPLVGQLVVLTKSVSATDTTRVHFDSTKTDAMGMYAFVNIPAYNDYGILVQSADTTLRISNRTGLSVNRDTVVRNVTLRAVAGILPHAVLAQGIQASFAGDALTLKFAALGADRNLTVYSISGVTRYKAVIPAKSVQAVVPAKVMHERGLMLTLSNGTTRESFLLPTP